ncbi:MAG: Flp family type IVb pilin [Bacillota bacterium]|nr:Flp family type IVb pilin [Bacillota bacterium]
MWMLFLEAKNIFESEDGQGMVEYGLIIGLISVAAIAVILLFGPQIVAVFQKALDGLTSAAT